MKTKSYNVVRIVRETYYVEATSKLQAKRLVNDPSSVTVIKETIKEIK